MVVFSDATLKLGREAFIYGQCSMGAFGRAASAMTGAKMIRFSVGAAAPLEAERLLTALARAKGSDESAPIGRRPTYRTLLLVSAASVLGGCATEGAAKLSAIGGSRHDYLGLAQYSGGKATAERWTLPVGLTFDPASGRIIGAATSTMPPTRYVVTVTDATLAEPHKREFLLAVNPPPTPGNTSAPVSAETSISIINLTPNEVAVFTPVIGQGGSGTLSYSGSFTPGPGGHPTGLNIDPWTGQVSGIPTAPASGEYEVIVTDTAAKASGISATVQINVVAAPAEGAAGHLSVTPFLMLTENTPVAIAPVVDSNSSATYALSGEPPTATFDRMYNEALASCLYRRNDQGRLVFLTQEGFNASYLTVAAVAPVLSFTRVKSSTATLIDAFVALFPNQVNGFVSSVISGISGQSPSPATSSNANSQDYINTRNLMDLYYYQFRSSDVALSDVAYERSTAEPIGYSAISEFRIALEQACLNPAGTATPQSPTSATAGNSPNSQTSSPNNQSSAPAPAAKPGH